VTKAEQIIRLLDAGWKVASVADAVGCLPEYVRAVRARHKAGGQTAADRARQARNKSVPFLERGKARHAARAAYRAARASGHSVGIASREYTDMYKRELRTIASRMHSHAQA
jgi:hypothetical protein